MYTDLKQKSKIQDWRWPAVFCAVIGLLSTSNLLTAAEDDNEVKNVPPKMLADFEDQQAVKIRADECEAKIVPSMGGHALAITTQAAASWPGASSNPVLESGT